MSIFYNTLFLYLWESQEKVDAWKEIIDFTAFKLTGKNRHLVATLWSIIKP